MADIRYSVLNFEGDGATLTWPISFSGGYISKDHVKSRTTTEAGVITPVTLDWVSDFLVKVEPPVAVGSTLTIYRDTPKDLPLVTFSDDSVYGDRDLNLNAKQAVFVAAEMVDKWGGADGYSNMYETLNGRISEEVYLREQAGLVEAGHRLELEASLTGLTNSTNNAVTDLHAQIISEQQARVTALEAQASDIEELRAEVGSIDVGDLGERITAAEASVLQEAIARASADTAEAALRATLAARVATTETNVNGLTTSIATTNAAITNEAQVRASADNAEASARNALSARVSTAETSIANHTTAINTTNAAITNEQAARAAADSAIVTTANTLTSRVSKTETDVNNHTTLIAAANAAITNEASARATADAANVNTLNTLTASVNTKTRTYRQTTAPTGSLVSGDQWFDTDAGNKQYVYGAGIGWIDSSDNRFASLQTSVNAHSASISTQATALATVAGKASAAWQQVMDVDGYQTGVYQESTGTTSAYKIKVAEFMVRGVGGVYFTPIYVDTVNNRVVMTNVYVDKLTAGAVTAANLGPNAAAIRATATCGAEPQGVVLTTNNIAPPVKTWCQAHGYLQLSNAGAAMETVLVTVKLNETTGDTILSSREVQVATGATGAVWLPILEDFNKNAGVFRIIVTVAHVTGTPNAVGIIGGKVILIAHPNVS